MTKTVSRYNIDSEGELSENRRGECLARFIPPHLVRRLAQEGYVLLRTTKGALHEDIMSGAAIPDRSPPKVKEVATRKYIRMSAEEREAAKKADKIAKLKAKLDSLQAAA